MSTIFVILSIAALALCGFGGWKAALFWENRTRDPHAEDPRDQEIRELAAALSVSRKQVETLESDLKAKIHEHHQLTEKMGQSNDVVSGYKQKYETMKESLNKEIESKELFDEELKRLRKELDAANTRLAEIDVEVKIASPGSGLVAGMDDVVEDDEKEMFTIRHEHRELKQMVEVLQTQLDEIKTEAERWKKHCGVMTQTNKTLRSQLDQLPQLQEELEQLRVKAAELAATKEDNQALQEQVARQNSQITEVRAELTDVQDENAKLLQQVERLDRALEANDELQKQVAQQTTELGTLKQLNGELTNTISGLEAQIKAMGDVQAENESLQSQMKEQQQAAALKLEKAHGQIEQLNVRVAAIDKIQEENERLVAQSKELRRAQAQIEVLEQERTEQQQTLADSRTTNAELQGKLDEITPVIAENTKLQSGIAQLRAEREEQRKANNELGLRIEKLTRDIHGRDTEKAELLQEKAELLKDKENSEELAAQLEQVSQAHEQSQYELDELQQKLTELQQVEEDKVRLQAELEELNRLQEQLLSEQEDLKLQLAEVANLQQDLDEAAQSQAELQSENTDLLEQLSQLSSTNEEAGSLQERIKQELAQEREENLKLTTQLTDLAEKLESRKLAVETHDRVEAEAHHVDADDGADDTADTASLPVLKAEDLQDDLKAIRGVGAKIEQKLNMLGICNFKDLLQLESEDYERAAELIPNLEGRMQRDSWLDQARDLHLEKYNEAI